MIKNLSHLKKVATDFVFTMTRHDWYPDGKLMGVPRTVMKLQTNGIQFEGGSWLYLDKAAHFRFEDNKVICDLNDDGSFSQTLEYSLTPKK